MVEYALLVAGSAVSTFSAFATAANNWLARLDWTVVTYAALALVALRIAFWAFGPRRPS